MVTVPEAPAQEKLITAGEMFETPGFDKGYELVKGEIVKMSPSGTEHMTVAAWLIHLLTLHTEAHDLGDITTSEGGFLLSTDPDTVRAPDAGFIAKARIITPTPRGYFPGAPDFAAEVVSPNDRAKDIHDKVIDYLSSGTRLVWVVYPGSRTVIVYKPAGEAHIFGPDDVLDGGDVLPGLSLPVREIFKKLRT
ncbi:MAG: Uma2 family endonuclease [Anaerolineae bacterium]|nr:Uma2 family endonuclease [Anaerolineae bacterium]